MRNSGNISHIALGTVRQQLHIGNYLIKRQSELPMMNNFDIKQKKAWSICFIICH